METSFKVSKKGKYIQVDYISNELVVPSHYDKYVWSLNKEHAKTFIQRIREVENHIKEILVNDKLSYDYRLIMYLHLNAIDNISSGLDIRSKMSSVELAERFVSGYDHKYKEAYTFCKDTLEYKEMRGELYSYMTDWRRHDKHNDFVREFKLPFKKLTMEDFKVNELDNMSEALDVLNKLIDERKRLTTTDQSKIKT